MEVIWRGDIVETSTKMRIPQKHRQAKKIRQAKKKLPRRPAVTAAIQARHSPINILK